MTLDEIDERLAAVRRRIAKTRMEYHQLEAQRAADQAAHRMLAQCGIGEVIPCHFVYLIRCGVTGFHKIGMARDPEARLRDLQVGSASPLHLRLTIPARPADVLRLEQALQRHFRRRHVRGEWFMLTRDEVADLAAGRLPPKARRWAR